MLANYSRKVSVKKKIRLQIWRIVNTLFFLNLFPFMSPWRIMLCRVFGAKIGENCVIKPHVTIYDPEKLVLGHNVWVGEHVDLYSLSAINIHHNVVISQYCFLCTGSHSISDNFATISKPIEILSNTWICAKCTVLPGAIVGVDETIYSAGSILK